MMEQFARLFVPHLVIPSHSGMALQAVTSHGLEQHWDGQCLILEFLEVELLI